MHTNKYLTAASLIVGIAHAHANVHTGAIVQTVAMAGSLKQEGERDFNHKFSSSISQDGPICSFVIQPGLGNQKSPVLANKVSGMGSRDMRHRVEPHPLG